MAEVDIQRVPQRDLRGVPLFRLHRTADAAGPRVPLFFGSRGTGRFDLPAPRGTCYLADTRIGAWLETFRGARLVAAHDARLRTLTSTASPNPCLVLDFTDGHAAAAGVTMEHHGSANRAVTWSLAEAADATGARGVTSWARHDPAAGSRTMALFDDAGAHPPFDWNWSIERVSPLDDPVLLDELAGRGLGVAEIPYELPVISPRGPE